MIKELQVQNEKMRDEMNKLRKTVDQKVEHAESESLMQKLQNEQLKLILQDQDTKINELESSLKARKQPRESW